MRLASRVDRIERLAPTSSGPGTIQTSVPRSGSAGVVSNWHGAGSLVTASSTRTLAGAQPRAPAICSSVQSAQ